MLQHTNASRRYSNGKPYKGLDLTKEALLIQIKLLNLIQLEVSSVIRVRILFAVKIQKYESEGRIGMHLNA